MRPKLVVIGNGIAGMKTVEELLDEPAEYDITVFGAEPYGNYNRIMLSSILSGEKEFDDIVINDRNWYADNHITLHAGAEKTVVSIDRAKRCVMAKDGTQASYDRLIIATGSNPNIIPVPGHDLGGVVTFRDIFDVETMLDVARQHRNAVVLGGGLLGLEAANGLAQRGMNVTVLHNTETILNRQLDTEASTSLQHELERRNIEFVLPADLNAIVDNGNGQVAAVLLADGTELPCDLFVMAVGVHPNIALAQSAGLYCERGIVVNDTLQTFDPRIYAVGECIQHRGDTFGLVAPLFAQAKVCANHLRHHGVAEYKTLPTATNLKVTGISLFSVGDFLGDDGCEYLYYRDESQNTYQKLVLKNNRLVGAVLYGETSQGGWYQQLIERATDISAIRGLLMFGQAYAERDLANNSDHSPTNREVA